MSACAKVYSVIGATVYGKNENPCQIIYRSEIFLGGGRKLCFRLMCRAVPGVIATTSKRNRHCKYTDDQEGICHQIAPEPSSYSGVIRWSVVQNLRFSSYCVYAVV
jgi:hypothetical protein